MGMERANARQAFAKRGGGVLVGAQDEFDPRALPAGGIEFSVCSDGFWGLDPVGRPEMCTLDNGVAGLVFLRGR